MLGDPGFERGDLGAAPACGFDLTFVGERVLGQLRRQDLAGGVEGVGPDAEVVDRCGQTLCRAEGCLQGRRPVFHRVEVCAGRFDPGRDGGEAGSGGGQLFGDCRQICPQRGEVRGLRVESGAEFGLRLLAVGDDGDGGFGLHERSGGVNQFGFEFVDRPGAGSRVRFGALGDEALCCCGGRVEVSSPGGNRGGGLFDVGIGHGVAV